METKEIIEFNKKIKEISISKIYDKDFMRELTRVYTSIGDLFSMVRLPHGTNLNYYEYKKYNKEKRKFKRKNDN